MLVDSSLQSPLLVRKHQLTMNELKHYLILVRFNSLKKCIICEQGLSHCRCDSKLCEASKDASIIFHLICLRVYILVSLIHLFAVSHFPRIFTSATHHHLLALELLALHFLHHEVLLTNGHRHVDVLHTFDNEKNRASNHRLLESNRSSTANRKQAASNEPSHNRIIRVVFLSVMNQEAFASGEYASPHAKVASEERSSVTNVAQAAVDALSPWCVCDAFMF